MILDYQLIHIIICLERAISLTVHTFNLKNYCFILWNIYLLVIPVSLLSLVWFDIVF